MSTRWLAAVGTLLGGALVGCGGKPPAPPPPPTVTVAAVAEHDVTDWDEFTGRLEAGDAVGIRPPVSGFNTRGAVTGRTDRESVGLGKSVELGGRRIIKKK